LAYQKLLAIELLKQKNVRKLAEAFEIVSALQNFHDYVVPKGGLDQQLCYILSVLAIDLELVCHYPHFEKPSEDLSL